MQEKKRRQKLRQKQEDLAGEITGVIGGGARFETARKNKGIYVCQDLPLHP